MIILQGALDKVQLVTSAAALVDVHASAVDVVDATLAVSTYRRNTAITTATTTDVVLAVGAGNSRNVKRLNVRNKDTVGVDVTVRHTDGTTTIDLFKTTLLAGETLVYSEGDGFRVYDSAGQVKSDIDALQIVQALAADQSNATVTPTEVQGLRVPCSAGSWIFEYLLALRSAAATTGHRLSVDHSGVISRLVAWVQWGAGTAASADAPDQDMVAAGGQITSQFAARAASQAGWGTTTGVDTLDADVLYVVTGIVTVTADGNLRLWHGSEVAAASTVKAGSIVRLTKAG